MDIIIVPSGRRKRDAARARCMVRFAAFGHDADWRPARFSGGGSLRVSLGISLRLSLRFS